MTGFAGSSRVALVLVDIQNDFCPGGALAVPHGDEVVPVANALVAAARRGAFHLVVATQDWHPLDHGSFAANHAGRKPYEQAELAGLPQVLWPVHCVQGASGAELHPALDRAGIDEIVHKGTDASVDSYSGFFDNGKRKATGLEALLRGRGIEALVVLGLATDYCVKATALDGAALGFRVAVVEDGCRAVNLAPDHGAQALGELRAAGVEVLTSAAFVS